ELEALTEVFQFISSEQQGACPDLKVLIPDENRATRSNTRFGSWPDLTITDVSYVAIESKGIPAAGAPLHHVRGWDLIDVEVGTRLGLSFKIDAGDAQGMVTVRYRRSVHPTEVSAEKSAAAPPPVESEAQCALGRPCAIGLVFEKASDIVEGRWQYEVF